MATTKPTTPADKPARKPVTLTERVKSQLSNAAIKAKVSTADLDDLAALISKLKALLA